MTKTRRRGGGFGKKHTQKRKKTNRRIINEVNDIESLIESMSLRPSASVPRSVHRGPKGVRSYFVDPRGRVSRSGRSVKVPNNVASRIAEQVAARNAKRARAESRAEVDELADLLAGKIRLDPIGED